jgi:hypothetical protein
VSGPHQGSEAVARASFALGFVAWLAFIIIACGAVVILETFK